MIGADTEASGLDLNGIGAPNAGFDNPVLQSQAMYRKLLGAMAQPGRILSCELSLDVPTPLWPTTAAAALTLLDFDTPLWLNPGAAAAHALGDYLRFHCGCPLVEAIGNAAFAIISDPAELPPLDSFAAGTDEYPDRSATLLIQVERLDDSRGVILRGPGIECKQTFQAKGLPQGFWQQVQENHAGFPRGVDMIFCAQDRIAALPRSTQVEV
ncbi:phosphonate C-P lyase system protein PhnH [Denitrobaculum tricleocarpae]|uniref:Phosphonate C-P lyase system protein PhnH n=1 Tax=Denitrobaculum tricleocarpae TaxID=2591009 RepID=A0A545TG33_9PROT|nr:phosphonate C-P lyase system protein PhnH [Denitrobaculum tricleocarpae]TQV76165.1 phosphonate C-P lyase system protein PhnH [Denitrobaculum tricleocarpae]